MDVLDRPELHVHHINGDKADNRPENLQVMTESEHKRLTGLEKSQARIREDGFIQCTKCKQYKSPIDFYENPTSLIGVACACITCFRWGNEVERKKILAAPLSAEFPALQEYLRHEK